MSHIVVCEIKPDALPSLKALHLRHLEYISAKRAEILFGGPARGEDGTPETMIIVLRTDDRDAAEAFIAAEPYTASGEVFLSVTVRAWSQVIPELSEGPLRASITHEPANTTDRNEQ